MDGFEILKVWQNMTALKRNNVQAMHKTGEMRYPVQRTVKNDIDDSKLIEVDNSPHVYESTFSVSWRVVNGNKDSFNEN